MIDDKTLNTIRGKTIASTNTSFVITVEEVMSLFERLDEMEWLLDEADETDALGTEGWRHRAGLDD